jgi:hypothetical protein
MPCACKKAISIEDWSGKPGPGNYWGGAAFSRFDFGAAPEKGTAYIFICFYISGSTKFNLSLVRLQEA